MGTQVWLVYRNADMTEGRGPNVLDCIFSTHEHAARYIDTKPGIMGRRMKWSEKDYGDWSIKAHEVLEIDVIQEAEDKEKERQRVLSKLSPYEKGILGIDE